MNGYFRLQMNEKDTSLVLVPPTDGGNPIDPAEILQYLTIKNIPFDAKAIGAGLNGLSAEKSVVINLDTRYPESECFFVQITPDRMKVTARFYPPSNGGHLMDKKEILSTLNMQKITFGIDEAAIDRFLSKREYCTDMLIAKGVPATQGKDAYVEYFFDTDPHAKPQLNDDGSVDFKSLNLLNHVNQGDMLAKLHLAVPGVDGRAVQGDIVKAQPVKHRILHFGRNIDITDDKMTIYSAVNGHVQLVNDQVFVSDVYAVENVDNSTGNIEYEGNVQINGNVRSGFSVKAKGNVMINGVVEGAVIEAGGNVSVARGVTGMSKGTITAGGNVICKFIENATVVAGGYVESEAIMHSSVHAKTEVILTGRKAFITGGHIAATNKVTVKTLGSSMGSDTIVEVGADPAVKIKLVECQKRLMENSKKLPQLLQVLAAVQAKVKAGQRVSPDQLQYAKTAATTIPTLQAQIAEDQEWIDSMQEELSEASTACVLVSDTVFAGTKICISDSSMTVKEPLMHCRFIYKGGEVLMTAL